jgi:hypothetical protein
MNANLMNNSKTKNKNLQKSSKIPKVEDEQKLLEYYRLRIQGIIKERIDLLKELEGINLANENFHEKEWELFNLNEKIAQLQQSLSEANIALNNERRRIIAFNAEIDTFKSKYNYIIYIFYKCS